MYLGQQWRTFSLGSIAGIRASYLPEYKACWIIQPVDVSPLAVALYPDDCTYGREVSWARGRVVCAIMSIFACKLSMVCPYGYYFS